MLWNSGEVITSGKVNVETRQEVDRQDVADDPVQLPQEGLSFTLQIVQFVIPSTTHFRQVAAPSPISPEPGHVQSSKICA